MGRAASRSSTATQSKSVNRSIIDGAFVLCLRVGGVDDLRGPERIERTSIAADALDERHVVGAKSKRAQESCRRDFCRDFWSMSVLGAKLLSGGEQAIELRCRAAKRRDKETTIQVRRSLEVANQPCARDGYLRSSPDARAPYGVGSFLARNRTGLENGLLKRRCICGVQEYPEASTRAQQQSSDVHALEFA